MKIYPEVSPQIVAMLKDMGYRDLYTGSSVSTSQWREAVESASLSLREIGNSSYNEEYSSFLSKEDEEEIKIALENNEYIANSYTEQLLKEVYLLREILKSIKK